MSSNGKLKNFWRSGWTILYGLITMTVVGTLPLPAVGLGQERTQQLPPDLAKELADCEASIREALHNIDNLALVNAASPKAEKALQIREARQGGSSWQTINVRQDLADLRRIATMSAGERASLGEAERAADSVSVKDLTEASKDKTAADILLKAARTESQILGEEHRWYARSLYRAGRVYFSQFKYADAEADYRSAQKIYRKTLGEEHPDYATILSALAELYAATGGYEQANTLYQQALEIRTKTQGEENSAYATDLDGRASLFVAMGRDENAEILYRRALEIEKKTAGDQALYATSLCNLGDLYRLMGRYLQAEPLQVQALEIRKKVMGEEHPDYARSLDRLAALYDSMARYREAEPLYKQALEIRKKVVGEKHPDYARSLNNLALLYKETARYTDSERLYQEALTIRKSVFGEQHRTYASSLDDLAQLYQALGLYQKSESLYLQALAVRRETVKEQHPAYAANLDNLASLYFALGRYTQAETLCSQALEIRKKTLGENHPGYAHNLIDLAQIYEIIGPYQHAETLYRQALEIQKKSLGEEHLDYAAGLDGLATLYVAMARNEEAEALYRQALEIEKKSVGQRHPTYATSLCNLGDLYRLLRRYAQAEPLYVQSLEIRRQAFGEEHPDFARSLDRLAALYELTGRDTEAEPLYKQAIEIRKKALGNQHPDYARSLNNLALLYYDMHRYQDSEPLYLEALAIRKKVFGEKHRSYASSLDGLAQLCQAMKRYQESETLYLQALAIRKETVGVEHPAYAQNLDNLASLYQKMGRYAEAETRCRQALEIRRQTVGENHPDYARSLKHLAAILVPTNRPQEASHLLLESAQLQWRHLTENFPTLSNKQKRQLLARSRYVQSEELSSLVFLGKGADARDGMLGVLLSKQLLFEVARQESGALTLAVSVAPEEWREQWRKRERLRREYAAVVLHTMSEDGGPQQSEHKSEDPAYMRFLSGQIEHLEEQLRQSNPDYAAKAHVPDVSLEGVTRALRSDEALTEYVRYQPYNFATGELESAHYGVFVLLGGNGQLTAIDLGDATVIDEAVERFRALVRRFIVKSKSVTPSDAQIRRSEEETGLTSKALRSLVWQPLEGYLTAIKRVYVAPDGELSLIPFEALAQKDAAGKWRYLAEDREVIYLGTGRDLSRLALSADERAGPKTAVLIGNPAFNAKPEELAAVTTGLKLPTPGTKAQRSIPIRPSTLGVSGGDEEPRLQIPRHWSQADELAKLIDKASVQLKRLGWSVITLTDRSAVKETAEAVVAPRILQFATHGYILDRPNNDPEGWDNPLLRSMLIMAGVNDWQPVYRVGMEFLAEPAARARGLTEEQLKAARVELGDGVLTSYEVTGMNLQGTALVNLTACETGLGELTPDGVAGLRQGFLLAGARSLTTSMWEVPAEETTRQIGDFYNRWLENEGKGRKPAARYEAFESAQLEALARARQNHGAAHPFYWAGTIFVGDPGDLPKAAATIAARR
jgi:tetratricopeptide (TPR) repeat protein/CHAT domain-containing protein